MPSQAKPLIKCLIVPLFQCTGRTSISIHVIDVAPERIGGRSSRRCRKRVLKLVHEHQGVVPAACVTRLPPVSFYLPVCFVRRTTRFSMVSSIRDDSFGSQHLPSAIYALAETARGGVALCSHPRRSTFTARRSVNVAVNGLKPNQDRGYSELPSA